MPDDKPTEQTLAVLDKLIDDVARQIGERKPGDPYREALIKAARRLSEAFSELKDASQS